MGLLVRKLGTKILGHLIDDLITLLEDNLIDHVDGDLQHQHIHVHVIKVQIDLTRVHHNVFYNLIVIFDTHICNKNSNLTTVEFINVF